MSCKIEIHNFLWEASGTSKQWKKWKATEWVLDVVCMKYKDLDVRFECNKDMFKELLQDYLEQKDSYHLHWGARMEKRT